MVYDWEMRNYFPLLAWLVASGVQAAAPGPVITVAWRDKAPYHYVESGVEKGILLELSRKVFSLAGIEARFVREPSKRIWANFQARTPNYCSIGWYHLPERAQIAQFSVPMHIDLPHTVLVAPQAEAAVSAHPTLGSLLADRKLIMGVVDGVSYGADLDQRIDTSVTQVLRRTVEPAVMMRMAAAGRVSFMLADRDDWQHALEHDPRLKTLARRDFPDMPAGLQRFIVCSKDVAPEQMARINKALHTVVAPSLGPRRTP